MIDEEKKWKFCPEKICYRCKRNLEEINRDEEEIITGCFFCSRSFVD